jgi:diguanylate cyclase (GGDEF)-like protein
MATDIFTAPSRSLGTKLVIATLGFCFVFALLTVGVRTLSAWKEAWSGMNADLTLIEHVYRQTLSKSIWEMDRDALRAHVDSAAQVASVGRIVLKIHGSSRASEQLEHTADGWRTSTLAPFRKMDLVYVPFPGGMEPVGELTLYGDERVLWAQLHGEIMSIVVTQLLQSLLLAGLIMLMFSRTVTVHVRHIAQHLGQITPENLRDSLRLVRNPELHDELSQLENGVNALQGKLADHLAVLEQYENELGAHRDHLADLVLARTTELESLTAAQQLVLSLSNRLIHAPHESFEDCQKACIAEVAERLGANHALWLVPVGLPPAFRVFAEWRAKDTDDHGVTSIPLDGLTQIPVRLAREELLFFFSQAEMGRSLTPAETAVFTTMPVGACALALLRSDREDFGILFIGKPLGQGDWPGDDRALLAMTAQMLLHSVRHNAQMLSILSSQDALRAANRQLEILSRHDPLTGLSNRRHFDEMKEHEFQRALRNEQPLTLLICDIDHFKSYNDHYGHAAGDQCLRAVANAMNSAITRSGDALARIGGEEFAILLPATHAAAAWQVAQRVLLAVCELRMPHAASNAGPFVTVSIGLAQLEFGRTLHFEALFDEADQALYRAKAEGRNRVCYRRQDDNPNNPTVAVG